jgi:hypothetical protein
VSEHLIPQLLHMIVTVCGLSEACSATADRFSGIMWRAETGTVVNQRLSPLQSGAGEKPAGGGHEAGSPG